MKNHGLRLRMPIANKFTRFLSPIATMCLGSVLFVLLTNPLSAVLADDALPHRGLLVNQSGFFHEDYNFLIWSALLLFAAMGIALFLLGLALMQRKRELAQIGRTETESRQHIPELRALHAMGLALGASSSLEGVSAAALKGTVERVQPDLAMLFLLDGDMLIPAGILPRDGHAAPGAILDPRVGQCLCGLAAANGAPVYSRDMHRDPRCTREECKQAGYRSMAALPLKSEGKTIGVVALASVSQRGFESQAAFLETLACQVSMAIAGARLYEAARGRRIEFEKTEADQARLISILENTTDLICTASPDTKLTYLNLSGRKLAGWSAGEPLDGRTIADLYPAWALRVIETEGLPGASASGIWSGETAIVRPDGKEIPVSQVILAHRAPDGSLAYFSTIMRDITEFKRLEAQIRQNRCEWEDIFHAIGHPNLIMDSEHNILQANDAALRLLGKPGDELLGKKCYEIFHRAGSPIRDCPMEKLLAEGKADTVAVEIEALGCTALVSCAPVFDDRGRLTKVIHVATDITGSRKAEQALMESEERLRTLINATPDTVCFKDGEGRWLEANDANLELFGLKGVDYKGKKDCELAEFSEFYRDAFLNCGQTDEESWRKAILWRTDEEIPRPDGTARIYDVIKVPLFHPDGRRKGLVVLGRDATESRQAEQALRKSETINRNLVEHIPHYIFLKDCNSIYLWSNSNYSQQFGLTPEQIVGRDDFSLHPREMAEAYRYDDQAVMTSGRPKDIVEKYKISGEERWAHTVKIPYCDQEGKVSGVFGIFEDITDKKRAEEALLESEKVYRDLFNNTQVAMFRTRLDGSEILNANEKYLELLGRSKEEVIGTPSGVYWAVPEEREEMVRRLKADGRVIGFECKMLNKNGEIRDCMTSLNLYPEEMILIGSIADVTDRKRAEREREVLQEQLSQAQKLESVGRLAGGVAHDFNNMLTIILGHAELALLKVGKRSNLFNKLTRIHSAAARAADLTRQLLAFARKQTIAPIVLDLNKTVESMLKMLRRLIGENVQIVWMPGEGLWLVKMDPAQIDQVLANLVVNARDAIADIGKVTIETQNVVIAQAHCAANPGFAPGEYVVLAVSDNGCGMDEETKKNIFEPFFTTKEMGKGTGLGLSTVYGIVKQNNGFIHVSSDPGQGTTFRIYIPRHWENKPATSASIDAELPRGTGETVLLVEDDQGVRATGELLLEGLGYRVLVAATADEAICLSEEHAGKIDLVLTDVVMPDMNGRELAERILTSGSGIRCVFTSGYTADVIAHHGVLEEGVHFIKKPYSRRDLAVKIREALGGKRS